MLSDAHLSFSIDPIKDLENFLSFKKKQRNYKDCAIFLIKMLFSESCPSFEITKSERLIIKYNPETSFDFR